MAERGIRFNGDMVRAILDGRKTQTRRVVKNPKGSPVNIDDAEWAEPYANANGHTGCWSFKREMSRTHPRYGERLACNSIAVDTVRCPYGVPGDLLYVRETSRSRIVQDAEGRRLIQIWLELTGVKVERVQDISEADILAEGMMPIEAPHPYPWEHDYDEYRVPFMNLWDSIYTKPKPVYAHPVEAGIIESYFSAPWDDIQETRTHRGKPWRVCGNPWLWALTFKLAKETSDE